MITPFDVMEPEILEKVVEEKAADQNVDEIGSTATTESTSFSGEETFFEALGSDFRLLANSFRETAGGVASFVQRSAMTVAAELSRLEENETDAHSESCESNPLNLPWEIKADEDSEYEENQYLKGRILALSREDSTFLRSHETTSSLPFHMDESRIQLIRRLLELDENLATSHARLSGRIDVKETEFWKNYFDRCQREVEDYWNQYGNEEIAYRAKADDENISINQVEGEDENSTGSPDSLVNADSSSERDVDFVLTSPPMSGSSTGGRSVDSFVIIDRNYHR